MRPAFRLSTRAFVIIEATCLLVGLSSCHAGIQAETRSGRPRDLITFSLIGWDAGIAVEPRAPGTAGFLEAWYRSPTSEDPELVWRIYGAAGTDAPRAHPERHIPEPGTIDM